jgi:hypothetical protein
MPQFEASLTIATYDHNVFVMQTTEVFVLCSFFSINCLNDDNSQDVTNNNAEYFKNN